MSINSDIFDSSKGTKSDSRNTLCELIRQLYDICVVKVDPLDHEIAEEMVGILEEAFIVGNKMSKRLMERRIEEVRSSIFNDNTDEEEKKELRKRRKMLVKKVAKTNEFLRKVKDRVPSQKR